MTVLAILVVVLMFVLMAIHVPIGIAMAVAAMVGVSQIIGIQAALKLPESVLTDILTNSDLATIPLFLLMGNIAAASGLSQDLYRLANALVGRFRGGLAMATVVGCGGVGAICGNFVATPATFMRIASPEMLSRGYRPTVALGSIAAGGTLGILIPPSIPMVIYAVLTEQFVIELFTAAVIPGLLAISLYILTIVIWAKVRPADMPSGVSPGRRELLEAVVKARDVAVLGAVVSGGIYGGIFTVVEAAAVGVLLALAFALLRGSLSWSVFRGALAQTAGTTGLIYVIIFGATLLGYFITLTQLPEAILRGIEAAELAPIVVILMLIVFYLILGCVMDSIGSMVITLPVVFPLVVGLGYDPIWWGVLNIMLIEIGLITPPIGIQIFILHSMAPTVPLTRIFAGVMPFFASDLVRIALMVGFPGLALWLPSILGMG